MIRFSFYYDLYGNGDLILLSDNGLTILDQYTCRTGSRDRNGLLINPLPIAVYRIPNKTESTQEEGCYIGDPLMGWKARLWLYAENVWTSTHLLIHPDGGKPGTLGCIGIQGTNAIGLRHEIDNLVNVQKYIPMTVGRK